MDKNFFIISWNHHNIPLKYRELLFLNKNNVKRFIKLSLQHASILEIAVLSTCNRIEFHVISKDIDESMDVMKTIHEIIIRGKLDWKKIRLLKNCFSMKKRSFVPFKQSDIQIFSNYVSIWTFFILITYIIFYFFRFIFNLR